MPVLVRKASAGANEVGNFSFSFRPLERGFRYKAGTGLSGVRVAELSIRGRYGHDRKPGGGVVPGGLGVGIGELFGELSFTDN